MTISTQIKICGLKQVAEVQLCNHLAVDAIGLVFKPGSRRFIGLDAAAHLLAAAGPFTRVVGLVMNQTAAEIDTILQALPLDALQFHGQESPSFCDGFRFPYYKAVPVNDLDSLARARDAFHRARAVLVDSHQAGEMGGSGKTIDWQLLSMAPQREKLILAGGLNVGNVGAAINVVAPAAVDLSSGVESVPGVKDLKLMTQFVKELRRADLAKAMPS